MRNLKENKMRYLTEHKKIIFKIVGLIFLLQTALFASSSYSNESAYSQHSYASELVTESSSLGVMNIGESTEVALDSFGSMSVLVMLILTSLIGAFFVRDEFDGVLN